MTINDADEPGAITMYLCKMNLELLAEYWELSHSWWEKLFTHHAHSVGRLRQGLPDIPTEVREHHARQEAKSEEVRRIERSDEHLREKEASARTCASEKFRGSAPRRWTLELRALRPLRRCRRSHGQQRKPVWLPGAPPGEGGGSTTRHVVPERQVFIVNATDCQATNVSKMFEAFEIRTTTKRCSRARV